MEETTSEYMEVRRSKIHNNGIFAVKDIPKGAYIIEYVGEKITKKEAEKRGQKTLEEAEKNGSKGGFYLFSLNSRYDIDGDVDWNTAKWINHSCNPNCEALDDDGHIWIVALRNIKMGEELSYDYGCDLEDYESHPCRCGSPNCVGYIVDRDLWPKLKKKLART
ncbi:MAG: SET domain-containing protein [Candidatus Nanoarchaeia archaeon]